MKSQIVRYGDLAGGGKGGIHHPKDQQGNVGSGLPLNPNMRPAGRNGLPPREDVMLVLPELAPARGQPFSFFLSSRRHPSEILTSALRLHGDFLPAGVSDDRGKMARRTH